MNENKETMINEPAEAEAVEAVGPETGNQLGEESVKYFTIELSEIIASIEHMDPEELEQHEDSELQAEEDAEAGDVELEPEMVEESEDPEFSEVTELAEVAEMGESAPQLLEKEQESLEPDTEPEAPELEFEPESDVEEPDSSEASSEPEAPEPAGLEAETEPAAAEEDLSIAPEDKKKSHNRRLGGIFRRDSRKLLITDIVLLVIVIASIVGGIAAAKAIVSDAKAADAAQVKAMQEKAVPVALDTELYEMAASEVISNEKIPNYSLDEIYALDLRKSSGVSAADLKLVTSAGLVGLEEAFVEAEEKYGVNCVFLMSIASLESAKGTMMFRPNNMFGYGRTGFSSKAEGIMVVAKGLSTKYLSPSGSLYGGSPTLKGVNKRYAANPQWYVKVGKYMKSYYSVIAKEHNKVLGKFE